MTPLEAEALLVRYQAALPSVERTDEFGRWCLLAEVVSPGPAVQAASEWAARERGVSKLALAMVATAKQTVKDEQERRRRRWLRDDRDRRAAVEAEPASVAA